jgi:gluconate kinase
MNPASFADWAPHRLYWLDGQITVDWCYLGDLRFTAPFFDQTIAEAVKRPFSLLFRHQTPVETLAELNAAHPAVEPTGFIFHMSRCGSTLISQMLAALPQNIVISEPRLLEFVFAEHPRHSSISDEQRISWLQAVVRTLSWRRNSTEKHFFIKFDSWQTVFLALIRRAFPQVPWVFVYREPLAVMASHERETAAQMVPGTLDPRQIGLEPAEIAQMPLDEYCALVLARICSAALAQLPDADALCLNCSRLPEAVLDTAVPFFNINCSESDRHLMRGVAGFDAKSPSVRFDPSRREVPQTTRQETVRVAQELLFPLYARLENASITRKHTIRSPG